MHFSIWGLLWFINHPILWGPAISIPLFFGGGAPAAAAGIAAEAATAAAATAAAAAAVRARGARGARACLGSNGPRGLDCLTWAPGAVGRWRVFVGVTGLLVGIQSPT